MLLGTMAVALAVAFPVALTNLAVITSELHAVHEAEPPSDQVPGGHGVQVEVPMADAKVPLTQGMQSARSSRLPCLQKNGQLMVVPRLMKLVKGP